MPPRTSVGVDTPQMEAFRDLMRAHAELGRRLDRDLQREAGLTITEYVALLTLRYAPGGSVPVGDLAREVHLTKSGGTRLVDRLQQAGAIERMADSDDGRCVRAAITPRGRAKLREAWPIHRRGIDEYFGAHLSGAEAATLSELLRRFVANDD